jgi:hypothetical protein
MAPRKKKPPLNPPSRPQFASNVRRLNWITLGWLAIFLAAFAGICVEGFLPALRRLAVELPFLIAWLAAAAGWGCLIARRAVADATPLLRAVSLAAIGIGAISLIVLLLGLAGWLNHATAAAIILIGVLLLIFAVRRAIRSRITAVIDALAFDGDDRLWPLLLTAPAAALAVAGALLPAIVLWPGEPSSYDVVEYHLQVPREWFELGRIVPLDHNVFSFFPMNVEVHYLLAMHLRGGPWDGVYLSQLMHCALVMLSVVAVFAVVNELRKSPKPAALAALLAGAAPWLALLAPIAYDEGGLLLFGTLSLGWLLRSRTAQSAAIARAVVIAGIFAGLACGSKLTAVPEVLLALPFAFLLTLIPGSDDRPPASRSWLVASAAIFVVVGMIVLSPWLLRNTAWTGNPVFPEAANLLGRGHFTAEQVLRWQQAHHATPDQHGALARLKALIEQVGILHGPSDVTFGYALPMLLPLLLIAWIKDRRQPAAAMCLFAAFAVLAFWLGFTHLQGRFLVILIPIIAIGVAMCDRPPVLRQAALVLACASAVLGAIGLGMRWQSLSPAGADIVTVIGIDPREFYQTIKQDDLQNVPADQTLALIGDARAYLYLRPMSLLKYRTVFDVDATGAHDAVAAWLGKDRAPYILIDPQEVRRLSKTYAGIPPLPPTLAGAAAAGRPFVITPQPAR